MKKIVSLLLAVVLSVSVLCAGAWAADLANFKYTDTYKDGMFTDVKTTDWYATNVKAVVNLGLMKGQSADKFAPRGNVTWAEAVTMAARIHSIYVGDGESFAQSSPWYKVYADYAVKNGIIKTQPADYSAAVTRGDFAVLLYAAVGDEGLRVKNSVTDGYIPDVKGTETYGPAVYRLYRAGVLTGDENHRFNADKTITRAESAAIVSRVADESLRLSVTLDASTAPGDNTNPGTTVDKSSAAELITKARQALALAQQSYTAAAKLYASGDSSFSTALAQAYNYAQAAAGYSQQAAGAIQAASGKTQAYTQTYYAYQGCLDASLNIQAVAKAPATANWNAASSEMAAAAELLSKAYNSVAA